MASQACGSSRTTVPRILGTAAPASSRANVGCANNGASAVALIESRDSSFENWRPASKQGERSETRQGSVYVACNPPYADRSFRC